MVKKVFSFALVVVLLLGLSIPAFCASGSQVERRWSSYPFQYISTGYNWRKTMEFIGLQTKEGAVVSAEFTDIGTQVLHCTGDSLDVEVFVATNQPIRFVGTDMLVDTRRISPLEIYAGYPDWDSPVRVEVEYSYYYGERNIQTGSYVLKTSPTYNFTVTLNGGGDIGPVLLQELRETTSATVVCFSRFAVTVTNLEDPAENNNAFNIRTFPMTRQRTFSEWFDERNFVFSEDSPPSLVDWLAKAVGAFLNFELLPGLSLNGIVKMIVVFGLVFWFITLLI